MKILVTPTSLQPGSSSEALKRLKEFSKDLIFNPYGRPLTEEELIPLLKDCDGYIAGLDYITDKVLESCEKLKVISRYGAGYDRVDIKAAAKHDIIVTNTPGVNAEAVGELAFGLALSLARNITFLDRETKAGKWVRAQGVELKEKTMGIVGLGAIGKVVARCAKGFAMNVMAYDPYINEDYCENEGIRSVSLDEVLTGANIISLHLPLTTDTYHLINKDRIQAMQKGAILINTSRGGIIDEAAAYEGLKSEQLGGLGLDAFEEEPPCESPLFGMSEVILTPHTGAHTKEATKNMADASVHNLIALLTGEPCSSIVTAKKS